MTDPLIGESSPSCCPAAQPSSGGMPRIAPSAAVARALLRAVISVPTWPEAAKAIRDHLPLLKREVQSAIGAGDARSRAPLRASAMIAGGSLVYWFGLLTGQLWVPAVSFLIGVAGAAGVARGYSEWLTASRDAGFYRACYQALLAMEAADGVISPEEVATIEGFISFLPLSEAERRELLQLPTVAAARLEFPGYLDAVQRRSILAACWALAYCDGVAAPEIETFGQLASRLGLTPDAAAKLRDEIESEIDRGETRVDAMRWLVEQAQNAQPGLPDRRAAVADLVRAVRVRKRLGSEVAANPPGGGVGEPEQVGAWLLVRGVTTDADELGRWRAGLGLAVARLDGVPIAVACCRELDESFDGLLVDPAVAATSVPSSW